jgi:hypothetical protein
MNNNELGIETRNQATCNQALTLDSRLWTLDYRNDTSNTRSMFAWVISTSSVVNVRYS